VNEGLLNLDLFKRLQIIMKSFILFCVVLFTAQISFAQNTFKATIQNEETKQPVAGARISVRETNISATTSANGKAELTNIPNGEQKIDFAESQ